MSEKIKKSVRRNKRLILGTLGPTIIGAICFSILITFENPSSFLSIFVLYFLFAFILGSTPFFIYSWLMEKYINPKSSTDATAIFKSTILGLLAGAIFVIIPPFGYSILIGGFTGFVMGWFLRKNYSNETNETNETIHFKDRTINIEKPVELSEGNQRTSFIILSFSYYSIYTLTKHWAFDYWSAVMSLLMFINIFISLPFLLYLICRFLSNPKLIINHKLLIVSITVLPFTLIFLEPISNFLHIS
ncbi:hypothetical protein [Marinicellulosiphila megalodicopiae]|uniref:hypothetical protein n=1 Tax=Marinicellulosiphila megalodicopiae TaxID=2724896 RepID=UPI003BAF6502